MTVPPPAAKAPAAQSGWQWCSKCQGLFYGPYQPSSLCPEGGQHNGSRSGNYVLILLPAGAAAVPGTVPVTQDGWAWCRKCQGLFYGPYQTSSTCPAGGQHDGSQSGSYLVILQPDT